MCSQVYVVKGDFKGQSDHCQNQPPAVPRLQNAGCERSGRIDDLPRRIIDAVGTVLRERRRCAELRPVPEAIHEHGEHQPAGYQEIRGYLSDGG